MKKGIVCLIALILLFCLFCVPANTAATFGAISFPIVLQEKTNWCWAACSVGILQYYSISATQSALSRLVHGQVVNQGATLAQISSCLSQKGLSNTPVESTLSFSNIRSEIGARQRPVFAVRKPRAVVGGYHGVVITGYDQSLGTAQASIEYMDPLCDDFQYCLYTEFVSAPFTDTNPCEWIQSIYQISR